jgi:hypothetical protein
MSMIQLSHCELPAYSQSCAWTKCNACTEIIERLIGEYWPVKVNSKYNDQVSATWVGVVKVQLLNLKKLIHLIDVLIHQE